MTSVADTRLLLTLQFPPSEGVRDRVQAFIRKEMSRNIILPSIVLTEFVKVAGSRIGIEATVRTINLLKERGMNVKPIDEELAMQAGKLLLKHKDVPFADALIASFALSKIAEYVLSDDLHFEKLGTKSKWF